MPVYEYQCHTHGVFEAIQPMSAFNDPCNCPACGAASTRILLTPPQLGAANRSSIRAHDMNERSADSPKKLSSHGPGCSCCSGGKKASRKTLTRPDGSKSFPAARPWMISH